MMKMSTKVIVTGAATMLGVAMVAGGAYAATGSMTAADAPGQVAQVSSVGPAAAHADANARGLFGANAARPPAVAPMPMAARATAHAIAHVTMHATVHQVARPAVQQMPAHHAGTPGMTQGHTGMHGSTGTSGSAGMMR